MGSAGSTVVIPVWLDTTQADRQISVAALKMNYDTDTLIYLGFDTTDAITSGWEFINDTETIPGVVTISATSLSITEVASETERMLIGLKFQVDDFAVVGECIELDLIEQDFSLNNGDLPAELTDGCFCVSAGCFAAIGDVDADGNAGEAFDALQILRDITSIITVYDPIPLCVKDTNCSGEAALIDAVLVLQRAVRQIEGYCVDEVVARAPSDFTIEVDQGDITPGEPFDITIRLTQLPFGAVYGYSFDLDFDPDQITFTGSISQEGTLSERYGDPLINTSIPGRFSLTHVNPISPIDELGTLIVIHGLASADAVNPPIPFSRFELAEMSEPVMTVGPINLAVTGDPCYDTAAYAALLADWPNGSTVIDMIQLRSCLEE